MAAERNRDQEDLFDSIPDDIIIKHILPCLRSIRVIACLSAVSRRFYRLCLWTPNLEFSHPETTITREMACYLDRFFAKLSRADNSSEFKHEIRRLHLRGKIRFEAQEKIINWILQASSFNLQELILEVPGLNLFQWLFRHFFPPNYLLQLPAVCSKSLRILRLHHVHLNIENHEFDDWISCCKSLEELYLIKVNGGISELNIESSSLRVLSLVASDWKTFYQLNVSAPRLHQLRVEWQFALNMYNSSLRVFAPDLKELTLRGLIRTLNYSSVGSFQSLRSAAMSLYEHDTVSLQTMKELLRDTVHLKSLAVNLRFITQYLLYEGQLPIFFDKLENLRINYARYSIKDGTADGITSFLRKLPFLKTLKFFIGNRPSRNCDHEKKFLGLLHLLEFDSSGLGISKVVGCKEANTVEIQLSEGMRGKNLVAHIVRLAPAGSEVTILYS